jgi:cytochrome c peroxidase
MASHLLDLVRRAPKLLSLGALCLVVALLIGVPAILTQMPDRRGSAELGPELELASLGGQPLGAIAALPNLDPRKVALGKRLFHDPRLSGSGRRACASCHDLATNGALSGPRTTRLDTPTVFNAVFSYRFGWEGEDRTLEANALATLEGEMIAQGVAPERIYARLRDDPAMAHAFEAIYRQEPSGETIADALAEFERSLVTPSRFDRWLKGDQKALNGVEQQGYRTFIRLGCVSCHQGRNVGGNLMQRHGIFRKLASAQPAIVRVPSLRNVAETAPYFHDGSAATLEDAVRRMASAQLNRDLSDQEIALVAAFLRSLTGTYDGSPVRH